MKSHVMLPKVAKTGGGAGRVVTQQQAAFELKQRVILYLNKLTDRDTHQIGVDELHRMAQGLTAQGIAPFLSCITDTDSDQKSPVRKECVRVMGTVARFHGGTLLGLPHISKMVATIIKRLKDTDSVVRDACVHTVRVLASSLRSSSGGNGGSEAPFLVAIVKPLFEALGEQNRYVQTGSALCLARVIDEANILFPSTPVLLPQMLTRVVKLLRNPHFMAKPAVIELIQSIVQAGGASTEHTLSAALTSILEALKCSDWTTRKAASMALAGIAECAGPLLGSFKTSFIRSLEHCRFDKVKPVRDAIIHAIQCWKTLPGIGSPEPSEAGSSIKEYMNGDYMYADVTSASDGGWGNMSCRKVGPVSSLSVSGTSTSASKGRRSHSSVQKTCELSRNHPSSSDWHIEISLPKARTMSSLDNHFEEYGGSCTAMAFKQAADANNEGDAKYDYNPAEDKIDCSPMSGLVSGSFETKHVTADDGNSATSIGLSHRSATEEACLEGPQMQERKSLDSTVTDLDSPAMQGCCLHAASELTFIRKQLLEIETKQSSLLNLMQTFLGNSEDKLSTLQMKVQNLEHAVDKIARNISQSGNYSNMASSKLMKNNQSVNSSPRLSTSTPRPSVESNCRQSCLSSLNNNSNKEVWGANASSRSRSGTSNEGIELWRDPTLNIVRNHANQKDSGTGTQNTAVTQTRDTRNVLLVSARNTGANQCKIKGKRGFWNQIKEYLHSGDMESAYAEALCSADDHCFIELMDATGPVLERLSSKTAGVIVSILTTHFLNQRFMYSIIPWFLQVVDLSSAHGPRQLVLSSKIRLELLCALREAAAMENLDPVDRITITECATKFSQSRDEAPMRSEKFSDFVV